jgi:hypothetical protein
MLKNSLLKEIQIPKTSKKRISERTQRHSNNELEKAYYTNVTESLIILVV